MSGDAELEAEAAAKARQQTAAIDAYPSDASLQSLPESPDGYTNNAFMHTISDIAELRLHDAFESAPSLSLDDLDDYQQVERGCRRRQSDKLLLLLKSCVTSRCIWAMWTQAL